MTRLVIGGGVLALSLAALAALVWWWWLAGHGRHRAPRRPGPLLALPPGVPAEDGPYGTETVLPVAPPAPSVLPAREGVEDGGGADAETLALLVDADRADFAHCPAEGRRTPHFLHGDGARTCCRCETRTAGDQT